MSKKILKRLLLCLAFSLCAVGVPLVFAAQEIAPPPATKPENSALETRVDEPLVRLAQNTDTVPQESLREISALTTGQDEMSVSINIQATDDIQYTAFKLSDPIRLIIDLPQMRRGILTGPIDVNKGAIQTISPIYFNEAEVLRLEVALSSEVSYDISRPGTNQLAIQLQPAPLEARQRAPAQESTKALAPLETEVVGQPVHPSVRKAQTGKDADPCDPILAGEKEMVSFDFQQADLRNILRLIAETNGFNVVISPEVAGTVTMRLINIPWNAALDTIMKNSGLGRECLNNIIRIAAQSTLNREKADRTSTKQALLMAIQARKDAADLVTKTIRINYANLPMLIENLQPLTSSRGKITTDSQTNTIILTDTQSRIDKLMDLVKVLDIRMGQVMIEARIVEINKNFVRSMGIQWGGRITRVTASEFPNTVSLGASTQGGTALTPSGFIVDLPSTSGATGALGLSLGSFVGNTSLDIQLSALETQGKGKILSSPKITTTNNQEATIRSGRKIPYQTVSQDGTRIQFANADISLTVTPHITADGNIYLKIHATKNAADFAMSVNGVPSITTREARTEVLVKNGETTVLGGLYESNLNETRSLIPFLGDIPVLGSLFRRKANQDNINELLIFITPTIVENIQPQEATQTQ